MYFLSKQNLQRHVINYRFTWGTVIFLHSRVWTHSNLAADAVRYTQLEPRFPRDCVRAFLRATKTSIDKWFDTCFPLRLHSFVAYSKFVNQSLLVIYINFPEQLAFNGLRRANFSISFSNFLLFLWLQFEPE